MARQPAKWQAYVDGAARDAAEGDLDTAQDTLLLLTSNPSSYGVKGHDPRVAEALIRYAALLATRAAKIVRKARGKAGAAEIEALASAAGRAADAVKGALAEQ